MGKSVYMEKSPEMLEGNSGRYGKGERWQKEVMLTKPGKGKQDYGAP